jgi:hypothetical protein
MCLLRATILTYAVDLFGGCMKHFALGFRAHSGWTALVAIALEKGSPHVLLRERPHLVKTFTFEFRQPYHTAKKRSPADARNVISSVRDEARSLAWQAISSIQSSFQHQDYELKCCSLLLSSGKPLPDLTGILASHTLIHAADGELFREALLHASARCGLETFTVEERELFERACHTLRLKPDELGCRLVQIGTAVGSPWTHDEKLAALVAWLSLSYPPDALQLSRKT